MCVCTCVCTCVYVCVYVCVCVCVCVRVHVCVCGGGGLYHNLSCGSHLCSTDTDGSKPFINIMNFEPQASEHGGCNS